MHCVRVFPSTLYFFQLPGGLRTRMSVVYLGASSVVVYWLLPQTCREILLAPGEASCRTAARLTPAPAVIEGENGA